MRIDKYLKNSRIIKRRTVANKACEAGRVLINGNVAKSGTKVAVGDIVEIKFGDNTSKIKVLDIKEHLKKDEASSMYEIM
ncbi:MAG: RNA-binding S4 domain-containing protein [Epulopiscium sp.]|nr:RNA-binding S4 domain-containing protein [Candidatus Epulonipiscium sp.]